MKTLIALFIVISCSQRSYTQWAETTSREISLSYDAGFHLLVETLGEAFVLISKWLEKPKRSINAVTQYLTSS